MAAKAKAATAEDLEEADDAAEGAVPGGGGKKLFGIPIPPFKYLLIGGGALLLLAGGGAGYVMFFRHHGEETKVTQVPGKPAVFVDLPEVLVNLANTGGDRHQYLKVKVVLELPDQQMIA